MLETLRAYGAGRLAEAGEEPDAAAALTRHALQVAGQAAAGLETRDGELAAARWLDAEDATVHQALGWALEHDPEAALRLAIALAPWWLLRGRWATGYQLLAAAAGHAGQGGPEWCTAQFWLGLLTAAANVTTSFSHLTRVRDALAGHAPAPVLARALAWRAGALANLGRVPEAGEEGRHALALARELGDPAGEAYALYWLATAAGYVGNLRDAGAWMRQAQQIDQAAIPGWIGRHCTIALARVLAETGEAAEARRYCADALALARQAGALYDEGECVLTMALLDLYAGRLPEARAHVREVLELFAQTGASLLLINCLELCVGLCAAARRWREAITVWAAFAAVRRTTWMQGESQADDPAGEEAFQGQLHKAREALGLTLARAAEERGAAMTPAAAAEYVLLLVTEEPEEPAAEPGLPQLSARERELVTLVAQGRTNAQIAAQLSISVRTVGSRLDRIRARTGCQRRTDLTRLALQANLVLPGYRGAWAAGRWHAPAMRPALLRNRSPGPVRGGLDQALWGPPRIRSASSRPLATLTSTARPDRTLAVTATSRAWRSPTCRTLAGGGREQPCGTERPVSRPGPGANHAVRQAARRDRRHRRALPGQSRRNQDHLQVGCGAAGWRRRKTCTPSCLIAPARGPVRASPQWDTRRATRRAPPAVGIAQRGGKGKRRERS
jgi:DNA-binding CsgD family transcriptional regulator